VKTIAIIGPDAWPAVTGGGGSSEAHAFEPVSILTGVANQAGPMCMCFMLAACPMRTKYFTERIGGAA